MASRAQDQAQKSPANQTSDSYSAQPVLLRLSQMQHSRTDNVKMIYRPAEAKYLDYGWGEWILERNGSGEGTVLSSPGLFGTFPWIDTKRNYAAIIFVKNIHFKDRQKNAEEVRVAVNLAFNLGR